MATSSAGSPTTQVAIQLPASGSTVTVTNRVTNQPAIVYSSSTGTGTISPVITDTGGNVPGWVPEGSYTLSAAASGSFGGATINWEAVYGAGVGNVASNVVDTAQLSTAVQNELTLYGPPSPIGALMHYAGSADPIDVDSVKRWMICDGRSLSTTGTYASLFAVIGGVYGTAGGAGTFQIPDLRGRVAVGAGVGTGLSNRTLASTGGEENHILTATQIPSHTHSGTTGNDTPDHAHNPGSPGVDFLMGGASSATNLAAGTTFGIGHSFGTAGATVRHQHPFTTDNGTGGGASHNNMQPYLAVNHIIRVV